MKIKINPSRLSTSLLVSTLALALSTNVIADPKAVKTTAFSEVSADYQRTRLASGGFKTETYIFGQGEQLDYTENDDSLNILNFSGVAHSLAPALAKVDYLPAPSKEDANLLIVVSWGKTKPFKVTSMNAGLQDVSNSFHRLEQMDYITDPKSAEALRLGNLLESEYETALDTMISTQRFFDSIRNRQNAFNANLLGYSRDLDRSAAFAETVATMQWQRSDLMEELESSRYFVILQAYDFQSAWKEKKRKLLWTTRFSIRARNNRFDENLWQMAMAASRVFGTETKGLARNLQLPRVEFGELEYLGTEDDN